MPVGTSIHVQLEQSSPAPAIVLESLYDIVLITYFRAGGPASVRAAAAPRGSRRESDIRRQHVHTGPPGPAAGGP